ALCAVAARGDGSLSIAAAANLTYALGGLDAEYAKVSPGVKITTSVGASGSLVAQISNGAPFDVFLSADMDFARKLVACGHASAGSVAPFAVGRLVLWTVAPGVDVSDISAAVRSPSVRKLAIANAQTAPYGRAAMQALSKLGLWGAAEPRLVTAENISQATEFVGTGNADAGFVALSAVLSPGLRGKGRWTEVPPALYDPLVQVAVITARGAANPESARYVAFLRGPAAAAILEGLGYGVPTPAN
ncbi:MAG TPA: molybdate ABC transporter substrate-binding protein, partial [Opitutaceae bacterium]